MPAPANDAQANAQLVPVGPYWGVISGTTVDATEDAGGPFAGYVCQEVWYHWSNLPAGQVYFYVKPATTNYIEAAVWSCAPGSATTTANVIAFPAGDDSNQFNRAMGQGTHTGGPMTMAVLTYVASPGPVAFQVGWGHQLDATASHWGTVQQDPWAAHQAETGRATTRRGVYQTQSAEQAGTTPVLVDQAVVDAAHENARMGVVKDIATGTGVPAYEGPGVGTTGSTLDDLAANVGQYTRGIQTQLFTPSRTKRTDRVGVNQTVAGVRLLTDAHVQPVAANNTPATFGAYVLTPGRRDSGLGWGFLNQGAAWALRNLTVNYDVTTATPSTREDTAAVRWRAIPSSMLWTVAGTVDGSWDRVHLAATTISASYVLPTNVGAQLAALVDGANQVVVASFAASLLPDVNGVNRWLVGALVDQSTLDDTPPAGISSGTADNNRNVAVTAIDRGGGVFWNAQYDARLPPYLPYLGFPLVPPVLGGWHVGRAAMSTSGPW